MKTYNKIIMTNRTFKMLNKNINNFKLKIKKNHTHARTAINNIH